MVSVFATDSFRCVGVPKCKHAKSCHYDFDCEHPDEDLWDEKYRISAHQHSFPKLDKRPYSDYCFNGDDISTGNHKHHPNSDSNRYADTDLECTSKFIDGDLSRTVNHGLPMPFAGVNTAKKPSFNWKRRKKRARQHRPPFDLLCLGSITDRLCPGVARR